jgi:hypothetical protein
VPTRVFRDIVILSFELCGVSTGAVKLRCKAGAAARGLDVAFEALDGAAEGASDGALLLLATVDGAGASAFFASDVAVEMTLPPALLRLSLRFAAVPLRHVSNRLFPASDAPSSTAAPS